MLTRIAIWFAAMTAAIAVFLACGHFCETPIVEDEVVLRYGMIPKGVVVEGLAKGFDEIAVLGYEKKSNEFVINNRWRYKNPVSRKEWSRIFKSLRKSDNLGVTLKEGEIESYGSLSSDSRFIKAMADTDRFLGGIIYGLPNLLDGQAIPGGYEPKRADKRTVAVVAFARFVEWRFVKSGDRYTFGGCSLEIQLIPMSTQKTATGGHLPDEGKIRSYVMEQSDRQNIEHLKTHHEEYLKIPFIAIAVKAGEAAAFGRLVRDSKSLDGEKVLKSLD